MRKESGAKDKEIIEKRKIYGKIKGKSLWRLIERGRISSD